jgi:hypothetical protein
MRDKPVYGEGFISGNSRSHLAADVLAHARNRQRNSISGTVHLSDLLL